MQGMFSMPPKIARNLSIICAILSTTCITYGQVLHLNKDSVESILLNSPAFTIYKNNYFITGVPVFRPLPVQHPDVKFQVSFKQRLINRRLPLGTYAYIVYTQKSFWDMYKASRPFRETNYNPGLLLVKPTFKNNTLTGAISVTLEHESNGRDSTFSRSWNFVSGSYNRIINKRLVVGLKVWVPFLSSIGDNKDLVDYIGFGEVEIHWTVFDKLFLDFVGRKGIVGLNGSMQTDVSYKIFKKGNQYLVLQWWYGYAESLIDYRDKQNMVRIGVMFKPTYYRFY